MFQISSLGDRIRSLRKQKKLTLEALAGSELTKGMLSLIENNKAKPSMESLVYIAERLEVEVSELLEEVSSKELRNVLEQAEEIYNIDDVESSEKLDEIYQKLMELIEPYLTNLTNGYEAARLMDLYSRSLAYFKKDGWEDFSNKAANIYDQLNLVSRRANVSNFKAMNIFKQKDYQAALDMLLKERREIERNYSYIDSISRLDFDYNEAVLHLAVGDIEAGTQVLEAAIEYSKKHKVFYRIDHLYRLYSGYAMIFQDEEKVQVYSNKLKQYGEFADDPESNYFYYLVQAELLMFRDQDYLSALTILDQVLIRAESEVDLEPLANLEKGRALYGLGRYEEALESLEVKEKSDKLIHPFDLSLFYLIDTYKGLCLLELNKFDKALKFAKQSRDKIEPLPNNPLKEFIMESYEKIREEIIQAAIDN